MADKKIVFLGGGMMAEAIIAGALKGAIVKPQQVIAVDIAKARRDHLTKTYKIKTADDAAKAASEADILFLAVKPQMFASAAGKTLAEKVSAKTLIVSIMAGKSIKEIKQVFAKCSVIRVMPNTPLAVGEGMTVFSRGAGTTDGQMKEIEKIFATCGQTLELPESQIDAVTGVSGSGPGFMFVIIDAMADAGVMAGLPRDVAIKLAAQTVCGSGKMVLQSGKHPAQLRDQVTSPGGTTIAGIAEMEASGVRAGMIAAVLASFDKSRSFSSDD